VKEVQASRVPSPPLAEEPRDLSRHFGINRYTLKIEIAATPTKQTLGTRVNRYKNLSRKNRFFGGSRVTSYESQVTDSNSATGIRNRRK
jgi:hypothetical protein